MLEMQHSDRQVGRVPDFASSDDILSLQEQDRSSTYLASGFRRAEALAQRREDGLLASSLRLLP